MTVAHAPGPRAPRTHRWIRSGNDVLHAVAVAGRPSATVCGLSLARLSWQTFSGPGVSRVKLELHAPICQHCDGSLEWEEES